MSARNIKNSKDTDDWEDEMPTISPPDEIGSVGAGSLLRMRIYDTEGNRISF
jgi:hypothetical protein